MVPEPADAPADAPAVAQATLQDLFQETITAAWVVGDGDAAAATAAHVRPLLPGGVAVRVVRPADAVLETPVGSALHTASASGPGIAPAGVRPAPVPVGHYAAYNLVRGLCHSGMDLPSVADAAIAAAHIQTWRAAAAAAETAPGGWTLVFEAGATRSPAALARASASARSAGRIPSGDSAPAVVLLGVVRRSSSSGGSSSGSSSGGLALDWVHTAHKWAGMHAYALRNAAAGNVLAGTLPLESRLEDALRIAARLGRIPVPWALQHGSAFKRGPRARQALRRAHLKAGLPTNGFALAAIVLLPWVVVVVLAILIATLAPSRSPHTTRANSTRFVIKRNKTREPVHFDKITVRIQRLCHGLDQDVDAVLVAQKVVSGVFAGVTTSQLDELAAETAAFMSTVHPDYSTLAARIAVSNLHKNSTEAFSDVCAAMASYVHAKTKAPSPLLAEDVNSFVQANKEVLDAAIVHARDFQFDYFGFKTLEKTYLTRMDGAVAERPQHMFMRVAIGIHFPDLDAALETYTLMSSRFFIHATPTLFNAGAPRPQLSSCFLVHMKEDSIEGIFETLKTCACISKYAGGIGLSVHNIRATKSHISGTNGSSNGLVPMLKVFSDTARYVDQGGGKRKGSIAVYLEPWHADIVDFLQLKKNHGMEEARARDLFYALWVPDLFMKRVEANGVWSLFCPHEAPGLSDCWGKDFEDLYTRYEAEGRQRESVSAQKLWFSIMESQMETGTPYILYKDACNAKSNHQHLGTIKSSNLCTEIIEYTAPDEVAVCNLASISLSMFADEDTQTFAFDTLARVVKVVIRNLNKVIDVNFYPVPEAKTSNMRHRPVGLGVQGLADTFIKLRMPYDSPEAAALNRDIFETMYFAALDASCELAEAHGAYETYAGSPVSKGVLQPDMWGVAVSERHDWPALRARIAKFGVRNSLLLAPMPTASTAQILGNTEAFEPITSNVYSRRTLSGDFVVVNKYMVKDLIKRGLWASLKNEIVADRGSVQNIASVPADIKALYKTAWELKMKTLIDMARDRGAFIDQSQSLNLYLADPNVSKMSSMHFYAWKSGLKTGMYYLRTQAKAAAIQFTVDQAALAASRTAVGGVEEDTEPAPAGAGFALKPSSAAQDRVIASGVVCRRRLKGEAPAGEGDDGCIVCSS